MRHIDLAQCSDYSGEVAREGTARRAGIRSGIDNRGDISLEPAHHGCHRGRPHVFGPTPRTAVVKTTITTRCVEKGWTVGLGSARSCKQRRTFADIAPSRTGHSGLPICGMSACSLSLSRLNCGLDNRELQLTGGRSRQERDFRRWLRKPKNRRAAARVQVRIDRLAAGNPGDGRSAAGSPSYGRPGLPGLLPA